MLILTLVLAASVPIMTRQHTTESTALVDLRTDLADLTTAVNDLTTRLDTLENSSGEAECPDNMYKLEVAGICVSNSDASASASANWDNARTLCYNQGLRLPTMEELDAMYVYRSGHGFSSADYCSSTAEGYVNYYNDAFPTYAWTQDFSTGEHTFNSIHYLIGRVRCVKSLN